MILSTHGIIKSLFSNAYSPDFDGVNEYVVGANNANLVQTGDFTLAAWVKAHASGGVFQYILYKGNLSAEPFALYMYLGQITIEYYKAANYDYYARGNVDLRDGTWHHVMGIRSGSNFNVYVDNVLATTSGANGAGTQSVTDTWRIGARNNNDHYLMGKVANPVVIVQALNSTERTELFTKKMGDLRTCSFAANIVSAWHFPNGTSDYPTYSDYADSNNGTMNNMESADITTDVPV